MDLINLNNLAVDANGRVTLSGGSSGIDTQQIVSDIIAAKRIPIDSIENRIAANEEQITALKDLEALLLGLRQSLSSLRGAVSLGNASNVFAAKQVFATSSRSDGAIPSAAGNLVGASATNAAAAGSHTLEVLRVATAHKVASQAFASRTTALNLSGSFEVTGKDGTATIAVQSTDSLQDIRDRVNNANTGSNATGVSANIIQASASEFILVLTADDTGTPMAITDSGSVLSGLGISSTNGAGGARNGLGAIDSKVDASGDGFRQIVFDGSQPDEAFLVSYNQATRVLTLTRGDGSTDSATLGTGAITAGETETVTFADFGVTIVLDENFDKGADILVDADSASVTGGSGAIDAGTIGITDSAGDISGIASRTLTFGDLGTPAAISVSVGGFSGTFDGTSTGTKTVTLSDGSGNSLTVEFDVTTVFDGTETAASIELHELENLVASTGSPFDNQLQTAQSARFTADGLLDADRFESRLIGNASSTLSALAPEATVPGSFDIQVGGDTVTVNYAGSDTLNGLVTKINDAIAAAGGGNAVFDAGTGASLMADGAGVRLVLTNSSGAAIALADTDGLIDGLGIDNNLILERQSNTVSDLFTGVTLTLFQAEEGTQIKLDVEMDLSAAKAAVQGFVEAYNGLKSFLNEHAQIDPDTGEAAEKSGILFGSSALLNTTSRLSAVFAQATQGVDEAFTVLSQIGIGFVDNDSVEDPLLANTLEIDETKLDEALLNNPEEIRRLFAFDFSSSDPRVSLIGFSGKTSYNASGYKLNINFDDRFHSQAFTSGGAFTELNATSGGPAAHGISAISFDPELPSENAYRYSYDSASELLTLTDLTSGTSESVDITAILDAIGDGGDLDAGETADVAFNNLKVTLTLTGDGGSPFQRGTDVITNASQTVTTGGDVTVNTSATALNDQDGGITHAGVADLTTNVASYTAATGVLTINTDSALAGELRLAATAGLEFSVDGGAFSAAPADDLDDGGVHTIDVRLAASGEVLGRITLDNVSGGGGAGTLAFNVGSGLLAESSTAVDKSSPLENYLTLADGSFEIRDDDGTLLGTVNYQAGDNLEELAANISANVANVSASIVESAGTFKLEVVHSARDVLTFENDTGGLIDELAIVNGGDGVFSANIDGSAGGGDNLSVTVSGRTITATSLTGAEGLKIFFDGNADANGIQLDFTTGFGARMFFAVDAMLTPEIGLIDSNISSLTQQNEASQDRIDDMDARLELVRDSLLRKFIAMETALATAKNLQENLQVTFDALFANRKD